MNQEISLGQRFIPPSSNILKDVKIWNTKRVKNDDDDVALTDDDRNTFKDYVDIMTT